MLAPDSAPLARTADVLAQVHARLVRQAVLAPVEGAPAAQRAFVECERASLVENRLGRVIDPRDPAAWTDTTRDGLARAAGITPIPPPAERDAERCFWIVYDGRRVGTVCLGAGPAAADASTGEGPLDVDALAAADMYLGSFYLYPDCRGRSMGRATVISIVRAAARHGLGVRLTTHWGFTHALDYWLRQGFWVQHWQGCLGLRTHGEAPSPRVRIGPGTAELAVDAPGVDGRPVVLLRAWQRAGRLVWRLVTPPSAWAGTPVERVACDAPSTLALHLARAGWPLVRSADKQRRLSAADAGAPEGLLRALRGFEAWDRAHGWCTAPRSFLGDLPPAP